MLNIGAFQAGAMSKSAAVLLVGAAVWLGGRVAWCAEEALAGPAHERFARRAERLYREAQSRLELAATNNTAAWQFGRACFDWAEFATNDTQRADIAHQGIAACRGAVARDGQLAAAAYYLGMNLGQLARTKNLGALRLVAEMETLFETARKLDEQFDYAGPDRNLGLLYLEAPGWPVSVGNRGKARRHLERAIKLSPDHPENRLNLLEAHLRWGEKDPLPAEVKTLTELLPRARSEYAGEAWEVSWADWDRRWRGAQAKVRALLGSQ